MFIKMKIKVKQNCSFAMDILRSNVIDSQIGFYFLDECPGEYDWQDLSEQ